MADSVFEFSANTIDGNEKALSDYTGKVTLFVNTASKCGFTSQYKGLEKLYKKYHDQGFEILGFPSNQFLAQEPGTNEEIAEFCELNFGVTFQLFEKIDVKGEDIHPLYEYLSDAAPGLFNSKAVKWNFTKFLVDRNGKAIARFAPKTAPEKIAPDIERFLKQGV